MFGLIKMAPTFISIFGDISSAFTGERGDEFIENKGWYEWPLHHIPLFMAFSFIAMIIIFWMGVAAFLVIIIDSIFNIPDEISGILYFISIGVAASGTLNYYR